MPARDGPAATMPGISLGPPPVSASARRGRAAGCDEVGDVHVAYRDLLAYLGRRQRRGRRHSVVLEADSGSQPSLCRPQEFYVGRSYAATSDDSPRGSDLRFGGRGGTRTPDSCLVRTPRTPPPGDMRRTGHQLALSKTPRAASTLAKCWQALQSARHARVAECPASTGSQVGYGYGSFPPHPRRRLDNRGGRSRHQWAIVGDVGNASSLGAPPPPQARRHRVCRPGRQACCSAGVR
jgi:hypothetical protein